MPTLSEQFNTSLGDIDVSVSVDGEVQKLITIAELVAQLIDNPPDEFSEYLQLLSEIDLPDFDFAGDLGNSFGTLQELIPRDISELNVGLLENLDQLEATALDGVSGSIQPAIDTINAFMTLLKGDITCGLIDGFMGAESASGVGSPPAPAPPAPAPAPAPGEPNPGPQNPVVEQTQIDTAKAMVDLLPTPLTIENLLPWLSEFWGNGPIPYNVLRALPFIDDIRGPLATLTAWQAMSGPDIINQFAATLTQTVSVAEQNSVGYIDQTALDLNGLLTPLDTTLLATAYDDLNAAFTTIKTAIDGADISGIDSDITSINAAIAILQGQHATWLTSGEVQLNLFIGGFAAFPNVLEDHIVQLVSLLQPRPALRDIFGGEAPATLDDSNADLEAVEALFEQMQESVEQVLDAIDLSAVFEPITEPFEQASEVVEEINQQLVSLTLEVEDRLSSLNDAIDGIDLASLQTDADLAIDNYSAQLQSELSGQFDPVRTAFESVMSELVTAVDGFDPSSLQAEIENVINTITGVFDSPEVQQALEQLQQLTDVGDSIDSLSFTPLTDVVIDGIEEIKSALDSIDESTLDPPLPQMLGTAMAVLPDDVRPLTNPLIDRLDELIEQGPINLIEQIKNIPEKLFDQVRQYDPKSLLGDTLSRPYEDMIARAREFSPENILAQVEQEFDAAKQQIKDSASPGQLLQPLVALHQQLQVELAQLNPGELIEPLDQKIQSVMQTVGESIDLDVVLDPLSQVIEEVNRQTDQVKKGLDLVAHVLDKLDDLADAPAQINAWIDGIFDKIPDTIDASALTTPLGDLASAIDNTRALNLQARIGTQFSPLQTLLDDLDARQRLTALMQVATAIVRSEVDVLPASTQKTDLLALLDSFNATDDEISGVMQQLATLTTLNAEVNASLILKFDGWDDRYHRSGGTLDSFNQGGVDLAQIKLWLRAAIDRQIAWPLQAVFGKVAVLKDLLSQLITLLTDLSTAIDEKIVALLAAPQALLDLGEDVQALIDNIAGINLDFLQNSINEIFDTVREKFNDLNPAPIQQSLDENFAEIIDSIGFDLIIPPNSFDSLNDAFENLLQDLESLNPDTLLVEPLQQAFEENIQPFIDSLDVTPLLEDVIERLGGLDGELRGEMDRVNTAYQAMLAAAPDTSISIDVDIGF